MSDSTHLRELAARMFILSFRSGDSDFAARLALRASDYLDQDGNLEAEEQHKAAAQRLKSSIIPT